VADTDNDAIRFITPTGNVSTAAGFEPGPNNTLALSTAECGALDGFISVALFCHPRGIAIDSAGNIYVADTGNSLIRKISPDGFVTTEAGAGTSCTSSSQSCPTKLGVPLGGSIGRPRGVVVIGPNQLAITTENNEVLGINF
jgi:hypothetical protein